MSSLRGDCRGLLAVLLAAALLLGCCDALVERAIFTSRELEWRVRGSFYVLGNWIPLYLSSISGGSGGLALGGLSAIPWLAATLVGPLAGRAADSLIKSGWGSTLSVRRLMQAICFLGCAASVMPLALSAQPSVALAVACLTGSLAFYAFSHAGFHSHLQDCAAGNAGVIYGITNTASIATGIFGNVLTGLVVEATGSYSSVFILFAALNASAAAVFTAFTSSSKVEF